MLAQTPIKKRTRPDWLKIKLSTSGKFLETQKLIKLLTLIQVRMNNTFLNVKDVNLKKKNLYLLNRILLV